jgi:tetratricopeptide (TPR) repeat protein
MQEPGDAVAGAWFADDASVERELRIAFGQREQAPGLAGFESPQEIARGGQAFVYRAVQRSTGRVVAIKVFHDRPGHAAPARRRFLREVELIAALRHPSIVTLFDGGMSDDGRPFLVMEYVDGVALDHADAVRIWRETHASAALKPLVELFLAIVDAVAHAHLHGVIHRDLKPGNVMVGTDGRPRVLDFGLARVCAGSPFDHGSASLDGGFAGTLAYASPEQARGETADLRSDVFSLGVMLFELLAGQRPFELPRDLRVALDVLADPPTRTLAAVVPELPADLGAIVAKAMSVEPARRYQSAQELARELRRFLAGEPIDARADSAWYQFGRRLQKWRRAVIASAVMVVVLALALAVSLLALRTARDAGQRQAEEAARLARALDWVVAMVESVDPDAEGEDARLIDVIARTAPGLDAAFTNDPRSRAMLRAALARVYEKLGRWSEAAAECERLLADLRARLGDRDPETLAARLQSLRLRFLRERTADLDADAEALCADARAALGPWHASSVEAEHVLAQSLRARRQLDAARARWERLRSAPTGALDAAFRARLDGELAALESMAGRPAAALEQQRSAVAGLRTALGEDHSDTWLAIGDLCYYLARLDRLDEAEPLLIDLRARVLARFGESHPRALTVSEHLAKLVQDRGRPAEAIPLFERVLALRTQRMGAAHRDTLGTRNNLAVAQGLAGDLAAAETTQSELVRILVDSAAPDVFDLANGHANLATIRCRRGAFAQALADYDAGIAVAARELGATHHDTATFRMLRASCLRQLGRREDAKRELDEVLPLLRGALGEEHPVVRMALRELELLADAVEVGGSGNR